MSYSPRLTVILGNIFNFEIKSTFRKAPNILALDGSVTGSLIEKPANFKGKCCEILVSHTDA